MPIVVRSEPSVARRLGLLSAALVFLLAAIVPVAGTAALAADVDHLVVSELVTGGVSASDEMIELYNPAAMALPLEGLELIYVSATGGTISRRAAWSAGAPLLQPGGHVLVANEAGLFAPIADALYATGMAAAGGSVALRILGSGTAIDAVGWGTAASTWREGTNAPAPPPGESIERRPGGALGSTQDTDDNATDFVARAVPEPQNLASAPTPPVGEPTPATTPSGEPTPIATPAPSAAPTLSPSPTPIATPAPSAAPTPGAMSVAAARAAPDGTAVTIEATSLTDSDFHDGGGFVADASGGVAVLVSDGAFARGMRLRISGTIDDRFSQRTIRASGSDLAVLGEGAVVEAAATTTGSIGESLEGSLIHLSGSLVGSGSVLTSGTAFDLDDGSGATRVVVGSATGIDLAAWVPGAKVTLVGVVGQRDSTGTGVEGYRVMPRDPADILDIGSAPSPSASPAPSPSTTSTPSATPVPSEAPDDVVSISEARAAPKNARLRIRGVVTLASGVIDPQTAVIQDDTGAIVLRLSDEAGSLAAGEPVEVTGMRSTKSGMETLRVTEPARAIEVAAFPAPVALRTGEAGEPHEALLVAARGALVADARRSATGTVSFELDDGSGLLRAVLGAGLEADNEELTAGTWVELRGVLGQETTGAQPLRGYRIWPNAVDDLRIVAAATARPEVTADAARVARPAPATLEALGGTAVAGERVGATLVVGPWPELGVGGLLWDGQRLVAIASESAGIVAAALRRGSVPLALELTGLRAAGIEPVSSVPLVVLPTDPGSVVPSGTVPASPAALTDELPAWVSLVGSLHADGRLDLPAGPAELDRRCARDGGPSSGTVAVVGVAVTDPLRLIVPCGGIALTAHLERAAATAPPRTAAASAPAATGDSLEPRRPLAAGILLSGALALAAAAAWRRRQPDGPRAEPAAEGVEPEPTPARLTLVSVPREHGP